MENTKWELSQKKKKIEKTKQNLRDQFVSLMHLAKYSRGTTSNVMPLLYFEAYTDLIFSVHSTTGEELVHGNLSMLWAGSSQAGWATWRSGKCSCQWGWY